MKVRQIRVEIYKTGVYLLVSKDKKEIEKFCEQHGLALPPYTAMGACYTPPERWPLIWVKSLRNISFLCHEVTHACYGILDGHGVEVDAKNHEALTYLQTFLLDKILKK